MLDGRDQIRDWFVKREGVTRRVSRHVCTTVAVDVISADEARSLCYMVNYRHDRADGDRTLPAVMEAQSG